MLFQYKARNKGGQIESDSLEASNRTDALNELRSKGLLPVFLSEKKFRSFNIKELLKVVFPVPLLEKITFFKNLSVMIKAGLTLPRSLQILSSQSENRKFSQILNQISNDVKNGKQLSEGMLKFPDTFSPLAVSLVQVGELSGTLEKNLGYLVGYMRRDYELVKKTRSAMIYPIVVMVALIAVVYLMFTFILPKLTSTFAELNVQLPLSTKILVAVVNIFSHYSYLVLFILIGLGVALRFFYRSPAGIKFFDKMNLTVPVLKLATRRLNLSRFTLTLSSLLNSGMPIVESIRVAGKSMTNFYFFDAAINASEKVKGGTTLSDALGNYPSLFPNLMVQMIKVGEESGTVETILDELNRFYEEELDDFIKNLSSVIEPAIVVVIGIVVGFMALALITPIYNISQNV